MNIESLRRKAEYYEHDAPTWARVIWTRPASFNHFIKFNRDALVEAGAIRRIGRDYFIDSEVFPVVAARILGIAAPEQAVEVAA